MTESLIFYHAPQSRSSGVAALLEELRAPHERRVLNLKAGAQREPAFRAINPMGKVPAIVHNGALVTEQPAIYLYLADLFPEAGLTPAIRDPDRAAFVRWLAFYGSCFEPAVVDRAMKRDPAGTATSPYGTFDDMFETLTAQLRAGPYIGGERMTAADVLWGLGLGWITRFKLVPEMPEITRYVERIAQRPAILKAAAEDAALAAEQAEAA